MNKPLQKFCCGIVASFVLLAPAQAHHGWGGYKERIRANVTIVELKLGNPHDRLIATDESGQEWNLLLAPPARNRRFGFNEDTLSVGDVVEIYGQKHPKRFELKVHCVNKNGENVYTYRYDNGRTSLARQRNEESCDES